MNFLDDLVAAGKASSRANAVTQAVERQRRRETAARDATILARSGPDTDLDALAEFARQTAMDDLE